MPQLLTKRRLGLFVLFLLITAGLTMPATADKKTRVPAEQVSGLLIGQWKGAFGVWIPQISLDITSVQDRKIRGVGREFGSKCTGPYEIRGEITEKGKIIYTRLRTESCPKYIFKLKMFRTKAGELVMSMWAYSGLFRVSATPGTVQQPSKTAPSSPAAPAPTVETAAPAPTTTATLQASRATPYRIGIFPCGGDFGSGAYSPRDQQVARVLQTNIEKNRALVLAYSHYDDVLNEPRIKNRDRLWVGGAVQKKPWAEVVYRLARERGLDGVVMCWGRSSGVAYPTSRALDLYLIDVERRQVYRQKGTTKASSVRNLTKRVFADFMKGRPQVVLAKATPSQPTTVTPTPVPKTVATAGANSVTLPAGTTLTVELAENLHSAFNSFGEIVLMKAAEDIRVDGQTVISKGTSVRVEISNIIKTLIGKHKLKLSAVNVETVDGQWVELDRNNFSALAPKLTAGEILLLPWTDTVAAYVLRGAQYAVTISRDVVINTATTNAPPSLKKADLYTEAQFKDSPGVIKFHKFSKRKPGKNFILKIVLTADMAAIVQDEPSTVGVVKILDDILLKPINPFFVKHDVKRRILTAAFDWWQLIKHIRPGETPMTVQLVLADGRLAQAEAILKTDWKLK